MFTISCLSWIGNTGVLSLWFRKFSYTEMWIMLYLLEIFPTASLSEMLDATWSKTLSLCFWKVFVSKSSSFYMSLQKSSFFCMLNLLHTSPHVIITSRFNKQTVFFLQAANENIEWYLGSLPRNSHVTAFPLWQWIIDNCSLRFITQQVVIPSNFVIKPDFSVLLTSSHRRQYQKNLRQEMWHLLSYCHNRKLNVFKDPLFW